MVDQKALDQVYMACARAISKLSRAERLKVGAVIALPGGILLPGFNGTPAGFDNCCENKRIACHHNWTLMNPGTHEYECECCDALCFSDDRKQLPTHSTELVTKSEVLHAESNAIAKAAGSTISTRGGTLYITHSPCFGCAKLIIQAGIVRVVYEIEYRTVDGVDLLNRAGVMVESIEEIQNE